MPSKTAGERETIARWSDDEDEPLTVYTHRGRAAEKLIRAGAKLTREGKIDGRTVAWTLEMPREWFRWPRKPPKKRNLTEGERAAAADRLGAARKARKDGPPASSGTANSVVGRNNIDG